LNNDKEGVNIDAKRFGEWLIVSYKGKWGISFHKIRINDEGDES